MKTSFAAGALLSIPAAAGPRTGQKAAVEKLDAAAQLPVLKKELFNAPVIIQSLELLHHEGNYLLRAKSRDGVVGYSVSNNAHMQYLYPILQQKVMPFFIGKDARDLDELIEGVYVNDSNYKLQGLAFWVCVATVEFALLDVLGHIAGKPIGALIGKIEHPQIAVYRANNYRGRTAEDSIKWIKRNVEETGAKAVKFKIGGRMSNNADNPPGRSEKLIPLVRETFGDEMVIYADSNGSYTVDKAIEIGRMLEKYRIDFYEEPVPFDWLEETKMVADALDIPIAGGEQESSMHRFRWMIANDCLQIVQPDIFYFGGMIRSMRVARMAQIAGIPCTPHISGSGLGYLYMLHFVSAVVNAGPYHEFKGVSSDIPIACDSSSLRSEGGIVTVPTGAGLGVTLDPGFIEKHVKV
ncbi:MAG TPA: mandelate racemase/muconate lactonizing enzyme family protein [bacterium]|nr:mandelate racemase/muconate lactonizing enzyme family protein [bacterium]